MLIFSNTESVQALFKEGLPDLESVVSLIKAGQRNEKKTKGIIKVRRMTVHIEIKRSTGFI